MSIEEMIIVLLFLALFSLISYYKKLLDFEGILVANTVGLAAITYGRNPVLCFIAVVVFFIIAEIASNYPKKKHAQRNITNVIGNSLPALVSIVLIIIYPELSFPLEIAFFGAVSAALADTLSSEVGYYSKKEPRMITTFKKVARGVDGGVTLLGETAAFFGACAIALLYYFGYATILSPIAVIVAVIIIIIAGMVGTNVDSLAGAVFETKGLLNNTQVNLIGSFSGAVAAFILALVFL